MKQVYKYDSEGNYLEPVILEPNEDESYTIPDNCTDKELPQPNYKPVFINGEWVETETQENILAPLKVAKMEELNEACNQAIIVGFDYTVNNNSYRFSCSINAQANFQGTDTLFKDGIITDVDWTVTNNANGAVERITLDQSTFNNLKLQVFEHINNNISKLRNTLQPQVETATTQTELEAIVW